MAQPDHPYMDFDDFNLKEGSTVGVKTVGGKLFYGTIRHLERNKATGEVRMDVVQWEDAPQYIQVDEPPAVPVRLKGPPINQPERIAAAAIKSGRSEDWVRLATRGNEDAIAYYRTNA